jgi:hypothetical protein
MKYLGSRIGKSHGQPLIHDFVIGTEELELLHAILSSAVRYTPKVTETTSVCGRLKNMRVVTNDALRLLREKNK